MTRIPCLLFGSLFSSAFFNDILELISPLPSNFKDEWNRVGYLHSFIPPCYSWLILNTLHDLNHESYLSRFGKPIYMQTRSVCPCHLSVPIFMGWIQWLSLTMGRAFIKGVAIAQITAIYWCHPSSLFKRSKKAAILFCSLRRTACKLYIYIYIYIYIERERERCM